MHRTRTSLRTAITLSFVALFCVALASPAGAQYGESPTLFIDTIVIEMDEPFDATGSGCPAGSTVTITVDGYPDPIGTTIADADGSYSVGDLRLPAGISQDGDFVIRASCGQGSTTFTITTTSATTTPGGGSDGSLARTGATFAARAIQVGVSLVAVGAVLVLLTTRRRENTAAA